MKKTVSKWLAVLILVGDFALSVSTLGICLLAILRSFVGALPYLTALIGVYNMATGYVLGEYFKKSKAENTRGGIVYETAMSGIRRDA